MCIFRFYNADFQHNGQQGYGLDCHCNCNDVFQKNKKLGLDFAFINAFRLDNR